MNKDKLHALADSIYAECIIEVETSDKAITAKQLARIVAQATAIAVLEAAKAKCVKVFTEANAAYRQTRDQHDDGRSSGAEACEQAIDQLIKEAKQ